MSGSEFHEELLYRKDILDSTDAYRILKYLFEYKEKFRVKNKKNRNQVSETFEKVTRKPWEINKKTVEEIKTISGIYSNPQTFKEQIQSLMPGSFGIWETFKLGTPYFSKDDDPIYVIDNPVLKERNWKVPMIRGSAWKGAFMHAAVTKLRNTLEGSGDFKSFFKIYHQIYRIFGTGSDAFRAVEQILQKVLNQNQNSSRLLDALLHYALFELGINLRIKKDGDQTVADQLLKQILQENERFVTHRGRAIFYPTYFERCTLEVINPHEFKRRKGTKRIFYEVVPKNTKGIFQLIYVPYDGVLLSDDRLKKEADEDQTFLKDLLTEIGKNGIGAKKKMWGRFTVEGGKENGGVKSQKTVE